MFGSIFLSMKIHAKYMIRGGKMMKKLEENFDR
jgi:hypothetical protein